MFCNLILTAAAPPPVSPRVVHVYVALCDNEHQGIVPVPQALGNGEDAGRNLCRGALYGVRTHFRRSREWKFFLTISNPAEFVAARAYHRCQKCGLKAAKKLLMTGW